MSKGKRRTAHRSSITGRFINAGQAKIHPKTTERERIRIGKRK